MYKNINIEYLKMSTLIIGVDIAKYDSVGRAFDYKGNEIGKSITFSSTSDGFSRFRIWLDNMLTIGDFKEAIIGMESTGHYWFNLDRFITDNISYATSVMTRVEDVAAVRKLEGLSRKKTDKIDAMAIAKTILLGKFSVPNRMDATFSELKRLSRLRNEYIRDSVRASNRITRWLDIHFPEYTDVFKDWSGKQSIVILKHYLFPAEIEKTTIGEILITLRKYLKSTSVKIKKIQFLKELANVSVGNRNEQEIARLEFNKSFDEYLNCIEQISKIEVLMECKVKEIDYARNIIEINGLSAIGIASLLGETGDLKKFDVPKQLVSYAGLDLKIKESGTKKGKTVISKYGNSKLRALIFKILLPLINHNEVFKETHKYLTTRQKNPLKKMQSLMAIGCKLLRIMHGMARHSVKFDPMLVLKGIDKGRNLLVA